MESLSTARINYPRADKAIVMKVLFYISGHGFGHATRMFAVMEALIAKDPSIRIYARTRVSKRLFEGLPASLFQHYDVALDVGVVEQDIFSQDVYSTLSRYSEIGTAQVRIVDAELEFVRRQEIDVIVSDIPPLASEVGQAAGVPTIAIGNFSWDFIYEPYVQSYPDFAGLIDEIRASYAKTDILLRLPFHHEMGAFPRQRDIPLVVRRRTAEPEQIRSRLDIRPGDQRSIILVSLRMYDRVPPRAVQELSESDEVIVLSFDPLLFDTGGGAHVLGPQWRPSEFPDIVGISDLVISKLGYGIVSECISARTPLMYLPRDDFAEYELLRSGMREVLPSYLMPRDDFLQGKWYDHVKSFLSGQFDWPPVPINGAHVAADLILSYAT